MGKYLSTEGRERVRGSLSPRTRLHDDALATDAAVKNNLSNMDLVPSHRLGDVKIIGVEAGSRLQPPVIVDDEGAAGEADQPFRAHPLQHPVDVDGGEAERVGQLLLGQGQIVAVIVGQPDVGEADV